MSDTPAGHPPAAKTTELPGEAGPESRGTSSLVQLLLIPSLIALACLAVMALFGLLASNSGPRSAAECLQQISGGSSRERWQAAYGLVQFLQERSPDDPARATDAQLAERMVVLFRDLGRTAPGTDSDTELTRRYLAVALGLLGEPVAVEPLRAAAVTGADAGAPAEVRDQADQTRVYAIIALARMGDIAVVPDLLGLSNDPASDVRKVAVYALGVVAVPSDATAGTALRRALADPVVDVRWNAALALARRGDHAAVATVAQLCNREYLNSIPAMTPQQRALTIQNGVRAARGLGDPGLKATVERLATDDPDDRVRHEARTALAAWGTPLTGLHPAAPLAPGRQG